VLEIPDSNKLTGQEAIIITGGNHDKIRIQESGVRRGNIEYRI